MAMTYQAVCDKCLCSTENYEEEGFTISATIPHPVDDEGFPVCCEERMGRMEEEDGSCPYCGSGYLSNPIDKPWLVCYDCKRLVRTEHTGPLVLFGPKR